MAPKVSYINTWASVASTLTASPPGSLFVIGGTDDDLSPWADGGAQAMTAASITAIQNWVKGGGRYLGICGGADVAPAKYSDTGFSFNALGLAPLDSTNFSGDTGTERVETVTWIDGKDYGLYFQMGSYFTLHTSTERCEIWANYLPMTTPLKHGAGIAAVQYTYGNGKVLVSGVHPEATTDYWDKTADIPSGWVAHTELLEALVADLLSNRVLP